MRLQRPSMSTLLRTLTRYISPLHHNTRSISNKHNIVRRNVLRKVKQGIDRLPSQGPDPASSFKHGWRLASAAVIERYPLITPELDPFEAEYLTARFVAQQKNARAVPRAVFLTERDVLEGRTEPDLDDYPFAQIYTPAPRQTEADAKNDVRSLERALDERLYLLVKRTERSEYFQFPQTLVVDDEVTMRAYAEMAFRGVTVGASRPEVHFVSHSPACHLEHVYPVRYQQKYDVYGVKVFFYRAMLIEGEVGEVRNAVDFMWAREGELEQALGQEVYRAVKPMLLGVGPTVSSKDVPEE